jgi:hypothetical protein
MGITLEEWDEDWGRPFTADLVSGRGPEIAGHLPLKGLVIHVHPDCEPLWKTVNAKDRA